MLLELFIACNIRYVFLSFDSIKTIIIIIKTIIIILLLLNSPIEFQIKIMVHFCYLRLYFGIDNVG